MSPNNQTVPVSAIVTPFEIAFLPSPSSSADLVERFASIGWLWMVNRCVDALFFVDMILQVHATVTPRGNATW